MLVDYVSGGQVAVITLNRPHAHNAVTTALAAQLIEILETISAKDLRAIGHRHGIGRRAFSVGGDLYERKTMTKEQWLRQRQVFDRVLLELRQSRHRSSPRSTGWPGGGCEMAISIDFIIASDRSRVRTAGGDGRVVGRRRLAGVFTRFLPPGRALQMLMTGHPITAQEAYRLGMVNEVCPRAELMATAMRIAETIAGNSPTAVQSVSGRCRSASRSSRQCRS